jgi:hypothetical protein
MLLVDYFKVGLLNMYSLSSVEDRIGEKLIDAAVHVYCSGAIIDSVLSYILVFEGGRLVISTGSDGESLRLSSDDVHEQNLQEYGETKIVPLSECDPVLLRPCLRRCFDHCVARVAGNRLLSIRLIFGEHAVSFCNRGDELSFDDAVANLGFVKDLQVLEVPPRS